jgi:hypothetical protein
MFSSCFDTSAAAVDTLDADSQRLKTGVALVVQSADCESRMADLRLVIEQLRVDRVLIFEDTALTRAAFDRLRSAIDQRRISVFPSKDVARLIPRGVRATPTLILWADDVEPRSITLSPRRREILRQVASARLLLSARDQRLGGPVP